MTNIEMDERAARAAELRNEAVHQLAKAIVWLTAEPCMVLTPDEEGRRKELLKLKAREGVGQGRTLMAHEDAELNRLNEKVMHRPSGDPDSDRQGPNNARSAVDDAKKLLDRADRTEDGELRA